jgi:hypothetical protein
MLAQKTRVGEGGLLEVFSVYIYGSV